MIIRVDNRSATIRSATGDGSKIGTAQAETNELLVGTPAAHSKPFLGGSPSRGPVVLGEFDRPTGVSNFAGRPVGNPVMWLCLQYRITYSRLG